MTKAELVVAVQERLQKENLVLSKEALTKVVSALIDEMVNALVREGKLTLKGFGSFTVVERKAFTARNPRTGEKVKVPATKRVRFTCSSVLKEKVNTKKKK